MEYTTNYQLPVWAETDRILRTDFNNAYQKLDSALDGHDTQLASLAGDLASNTAAHAAFGNCLIYTASYVGTGSSTPISHTFPAKPFLICVLETDSGYGFLALQGAAIALVGNEYLALTWNQTTATWYNGGSAAGGMDYPGRSYRILALLEKEE